MDIRVAIFEDNKLVRDALEAILNGTPGYSCSGAYADAQLLLSRIKSSNPDVVLMDIEMPGISGIEATKLIAKEFPDVKVLIQTVFNDSEKIFLALSAGASGYVWRATGLSRLACRSYGPCTSRDLATINRTLLRN